MRSAGTVEYRSIGGQRLRLDIRRGDGTGTPLLLCSGIAAGFEMFDPFVDALDPGIEIIRVDTPGVGGSPAALLPLGFPQLAWMLDRLLGELGYRQVDVLGYSWGGALAQQFALQHRSRCRRLVLVSTSTGVLSFPGDADVLTGMLRPTSRTDGRFEMPEALLRNTSGHRSGAVRVVLDRAGVSEVGCGYLHQLVAVGTWSSLPFLPLLGQPVLVMSGVDDPLLPIANAHLMAALLPRASLETFPGGHFEIIAAPSAIAPAVGRFLAVGS